MFFSVGRFQQMAASTSLPWCNCDSILCYQCKWILCFIMFLAVCLKGYKHIVDVPAVLQTETFFATFCLLSCAQNPFWKGVDSEKRMYLGDFIPLQVVCQQDRQYSFDISTWHARASIPLRRWFKYFENMGLLYYWLEFNLVSNL